jgi:iron complex outermembrane recepter protein
MRLRYAASLFAIATGLSSAAAAQAQAQNPEGGAAQTDPAGQVQPADQAAVAQPPARDDGVAEIVVTAQRRAETVQNSSLSLSVVDAAAVTNSGLSQPEGLSRLVPNLQIGSFVFSRVYLRGVGDNTVNGFAQSAVAFNVDGVHVARATQFAGNFYDVARIEVLKGPQGTLYGRNASAGVINVITNEPTRDFGGNVLVNVGNYDLFQVQGALNVPLSDTLAVRGAFNLVRRDGYLEDGYNDDRQQSGRVRLLWRPSADFSLGVRADYTHTGGMGQASVVFPTPAGADPWMAASGDLVRSYQIATGAPRVPDDGFVDNDYASISAELNANLGFAELTVIPAYRWQDFEFFSSTAGTLNFGEKDRVNQHSLELRLARNTERFNIVVGGFYFHEVTRADGRIEQGARVGATTGFSAIRTFYRAPTEAIAAFADGRVSLTDGFRLLAGIRYTDETRGLFGQTTTYANIPSVPLCPADILPSSPNPTYIYCLRARADNEVQNDAVTWRAGAELDLAPHSMAYFRVDRGFKSGGIFSGAAPGNDYRPEFLTSYAGGIRNRFFDNRLQVNVEGFYWDYTDYQFTFVNFDERGVSALVTRNVGAARIYGGNVDVVWRPTRRDTVTANVEYLNARFTSFVYTTPQAADPNRECASLGVVGQVTPPGRPPVNLFGFDCAGAALPRAPRWTIRAGWNHEFPLANGAAIIADADAQYSSSYKLDLTKVAFLTQEPYVLLNAQLTYRSPDERWTISAWMRNITNEAVYNDARRYGSTSFAGADIRPPRTFGVRGTFSF